MTTIVTVPANLVGDLRNGLHNVLSETATEVSGVADRAGREMHPEWYEKPIERFKDTCALLDLTGWSAPRQLTAVQIDLREHRRALIDALEMALLLTDVDLEQIEAVDAARAARHEPPAREATITRVLALREFATTVSEMTASIDAQTRLH